MTRSKVISGSWQFNVNAGLSATSLFSIFSPGRKIKIRSILSTLSIYDNTANLFVSWRNTPFHKIALTLADTGPVIAGNFNVTGGVSPYASGSVIELFEPGQVFFNGFYVENELRFRLTIDNASANPCTYNISVVVEVEEETIFS